MAVSLSVSSCAPHLSADVVDDYSLKTGRVTDADSGKPIAGAFVIAEGLVTESGGLVESRTSTRAEYRIVTKTDNDGRFEIPDLIARFENSKLDFGHGLRRWNLYAMVPGYISVGDLNALPPAEGNGEIRISPPSVHETPTHTREGKSLIVDLKLKKHEMTVAQAVSYYLSFVNRSPAEYQLSPAVNSQIPLALFNHFKPVVCFQPSGTRLDTASATDMLEYMTGESANHNAGEDVLKKLEPDGFTSFAGRLIYKQPVEYSSFLAANVCQALQAEE
jgi:hypothetical protein